MPHSHTINSWAKALVTVKPGAICHIQHIHLRPQYAHDTDLMAKVMVFYNTNPDLSLSLWKQPCAPQRLTLFSIACSLQREMVCV